MFNAKKSRNIPQSLLNTQSYDGEDVTTQLLIDFNGKCYLCGDKTNKDDRVEHFFPDDSLKFNWNNLFLACDYCNNRKLAIYNKPNKYIINAVTEKPEDFISHQFTEDNAIYKVVLKEKQYHQHFNNTFELLDSLYNKPNEGGFKKKKTGDLINNLNKEYTEFKGLIFKYMDGYYLDELDDIEKNIKIHLSDDSAFLEFKREYLCLNNIILQL